MSKTSWQTGNLKTERRFGESFQDMLCPRGEFGKKIFWLLRLKNWKVGCNRNISQKTECERSPDNHKKMKNLYFLWQMVQQNYQEETTRRESTARREKLSGESQGDREEFQPEGLEDDAEVRKDFWSGYFIYCHHIEPTSSTYVPREESFLISKIYIIERNFSKKKYTMRWEDWREAKTSEAKQIHMEGRNSVPCYKFAQEFVPMKRSQGSSSLNSLWRWKQAHVVSSRGTAYLWDKNSSSNRQSPGSTRFQVWTWDERNTNSECGSDQRTSGIENYVWFRRLWISVSQRRMPRETEKHKQKIFHPKQCCWNGKATMGKEWKEVIKKAHQNKR